MLFTHAGKEVFSDIKKIESVTSLNLSECLKQINKQRLPLACAPISELLSKISTMSC